jgi:nitrogen fixation protein NifU and related proteins
VTTYRTIVLDHFKHPRNRGPLDDASHSADGANPLCGDRIRVQLRIDGDVVADARFVADACALCIASASLLTEHLRGLRVCDASRVDAAWIFGALEGEPPPGRRKCAILPIDTMQRALSS